MKYEEIVLDKFIVVGMSVRTTNQNNQSQQDIAKLWEAFFRNAAIHKIHNKVSDDIYCVYTDYESDYTREYTTLIGYKVSDTKDIPAGLNLTVKEFPDSKYYKFLSDGKLPYAVGKTWAYIWQSGINRRYLADFDIYGEDAKDTKNAKITTFLSIK